MASNADQERKAWLQSAKLVERLNEERKKRERDQFRRQERLKTYLDNQATVG